MAVKSVPDLATTQELPERGPLSAHGGQQLLSDACVALAASLDLGEAIDRVARIVVPSLADWCIIDLIEGDGSEHTVRRAAAVHGDSGAQALLDEMSHRFPPRADHPTLSKTVIETGAPVLVAEVPEEMIDRFVGPCRRRS